MSFRLPWNLYQWFISSTAPEKKRPRDSYPHGQPPGLLSLPNELLVNVLAWLDCLSIFSVRMACRRLHSVAKSRHLWRAVISRLHLECGLVPPEEGISAYSITELEKWTLRRCSAHAAWESHSQAQPSIRLVSFGNPDLDLCPPVPYLLPGGRWFLLANSSSLMQVFDLDCANPTPKFLLNPTELDKDLTEYVRYTFWIDYSNPCLSFYIAGNAYNKNNSRTFIYSVQLTGHGPNATLTASFVAAFHSYGHKGWHLGRYTLNKHYYLEVRADPKNTQIQNVLAYRFEEARRRVHGSIKPAALTSISGDEIGLAAFIYDNVFAVFTAQDDLKLYDIIAPETRSSGAFSSQMNLLHTIPFSGYCFSNIRYSPRESYLVSISYDGDFKGIRIPHDRTILPTVVELGKHHTFLEQPIGSELGTSVSIAMSAHDTHIEVVSHPWIQVGKGSLTANYLERCLKGPRIPLLRMQSEIACFSEDLGRLLIFRDDSQSSVVVVDLTSSRYLHN